MPSARSLPRNWYEEQIRYHFLQVIYDRTDRSGSKVASSRDIASALHLPIDEALRIIGWLEYHGYLHCFGSSRSVSISRAGTKYLEEVARRRRSIRA